MRPTLWRLTAANARLDRMDEARSVIERLWQGGPGMAVANIHKDRSDKEPSRISVPPPPGYAAELRVPGNTSGRVRVVLAPMR